MATQKLYKLIDTQDAGGSRCIDCGRKAGVEYRYYKNRLTGEEVSARVRTACGCRGEVDPYQDVVIEKVEK